MRRVIIGMIRCLRVRRPQRRPQVTKDATLFLSDRKEKPLVAKGSFHKTRNLPSQEQEAVTSVQALAPRASGHRECVPSAPGRGRAEDACGPTPISASPGQMPESVPKTPRCKFLVSQSNLSAASYIGRAERGPGFIFRRQKHQNGVSGYTTFAEYLEYRSEPVKCHHKSPPRYPGPYVWKALLRPSLSLVAILWP